MIVRRFLLWARHAPASQRAEAVRALAQTYLSGVLGAEDQVEAETALTAMLDDPSPLVRAALAETLCGSARRAPPRHPRACGGPGRDRPMGAAHGSPLLADGDLVDCAALGDGRVQAAIAARRRALGRLSAALAEIGSSRRSWCSPRNPGADILDTSLARMVERHGSDGALREALLERADLPVEIAQALAAALAATSAASSAAAAGSRPSARRGSRARRASARPSRCRAVRTSDDVARLVDAPATLGPAHAGADPARAAVLRGSPSWRRRSPTWPAPR